MPNSAKAIGVFGGSQGESRSIYWRCPECGTAYDDECVTVPDPYIAVCDLAAKHATKAPIQFEVILAPTPLGGTVTINQREIFVTDAFCFLFNGCLEIDFQSPVVDGGCENIPFGDAIEFSELNGQTISIADCLNAKYDNSLFKPSFFLDHDYYSISSLHVYAIQYLRDSDVLSLKFEFEAKLADSPLTISVRLELSALCRPVEQSDVLNRLGLIPIRFAKTYLPLLGLPAISKDATCTDLISLFGEPDHQGGGNHPICGLIPKWIRYTFPVFYLHFQMECDAVTTVTIMSREGPFAASFPE